MRGFRLQPIEHAARLADARGSGERGHPIVDARLRLRKSPAASGGRPYGSDGAGCMESTDSILFASENLLVRHVRGDAGGVRFVTFDSYNDERTLDRPGFGDAYFRPRRIDAIHVISRDNHWYQHPELPDALAAVAGALAGSRCPVIAYGSSMGGFAALHYGSACGADVGIALSPQYSVDPAVVPFEDRWLPDAARISFRDEQTVPLPLQYIVYDSVDRQDARHAALFAARSPTILLRIPHGGHPTGAYINDVGLFDSLFHGVRTGILTQATAASFERALRLGRRRSGQYFFTLSLRVPLSRLGWKLALARMAVAANPGDPPYLSYLALMLDRAGEHAEARACHDRAIEMSGGTLHAVHHLAFHHEKVGEFDEAQRIVAELIAAHPHVQVLQASEARIARKRRRATPIGRIVHLLRLEGVLARLRGRGSDQAR